MTKEQLGETIKFLIVAIVGVFVAWFPELESAQSELIAMLGVAALGLLFGLPALQIIAQLLPALKTLAAKTPNKADDQLVAVVETMLQERGLVVNATPQP